MDDCLESDRSDWSDNEEQDYLETQSHDSDLPHLALTRTSSSAGLYRGRYDRRRQEHHDYHQEPDYDGQEHQIHQNHHHYLQLEPNTREHRKHEDDTAPRPLQSADTQNCRTADCRSVTPENRPSAPVAAARQPVARKPVIQEIKTAKFPAEKRELATLESNQEEPQSATAIGNLSRCARYQLAHSRTHVLCTGLNLLTMRFCRGLGQSVRRAQQLAQTETKPRVKATPAHECPLDTSILLSSIMNGVGSSYTVGAGNESGRRKRNNSTKNVASGQQRRCAFHFVEVAYRNAVAVDSHCYDWI